MSDDRIATNHEIDNQKSSRFWAFDDDYLAADETILSDGPGGGLVDLGFLAAALRRRARLVCAIAMAGLIIGITAGTESAHAHQATTSILVASSPGQPAGSAAYDDQAIIQSRVVAAEAARSLGLQPSGASGLIGTYTATVVTSEVLTITATAASTEAAVRDANAVADAFLAFHAHLLIAQEQLVNNSLRQQIAAANQRVDLITTQINALSIQPSSASTQAQLEILRTERTTATTDLDALEQANTNNSVNGQIAAITSIEDTQILDPASPVPLRRKKHLIEYGSVGLLVGLALAIAVVLIGAVISDRPRRRDDVAQALGAPIRLSVPLRLRRWQSSRRLGAAENRDVRRVVAYLRRALGPTPCGPASLAIVPVDDFRVPAICLASLAISCADQGMRVVVADLCPGAPLARILTAAEQGIQLVRIGDAQLVVAVPDIDERPLGPLGTHVSRTARLDELTATCTTADVLLTLTALDPATGAAHLSTWAATVVAMITAGRSSYVRVAAVGEMVRLAGIPRFSAVLLGADRSDESLGLPPESGASDPAVRVPAHTPSP